MIARFLNERMALLPAPKTVDKFLEIIGSKYNFELDLSWRRFHNDGIPGTQKFLGGKLWFVFLAVLKNHNFIDIFVHGGYWQLDSFGKFGQWRFETLGSKLYTDNEENRKKLSGVIIKVSQKLSSCSSVEDIFSTLKEMDKKNSDYHKYID